MRERRRDCVTAAADPANVIPDPVHAAAAPVGNVGHVVHQFNDIHRLKKYENEAKN
jgi:hypothetical protein